ncbi:hypothetical protein BO71DRAFT_395671 [Aspergillus ellipticus CBS 707.79]|uniref:Uncharacterized protein n=1 Tax=Aspergillus ellipticus CBS 707.79 TaxID=1448320 RepID=A0A319F0M7_9EURO|nr:hypothetical protein BO71DRAFT_395671 [Aspergillus ellipticus CBS 707.79]
MPLIKLWHFTLLPTTTPTDPSLIALLTEITTFCATYTNPTSSPSAPETHAFYHDIQDPRKLVMITGYPTQEMNEEADRAYVEKYIGRMKELVKHEWLRQIELDVTSLGLGEDMVVACGPEEREVGGWDVWKGKPQGEGKVWVMVKGGKELEGDGLILKKIVGR